MTISIHALRVEGDIWRAAGLAEQPISIHALRVEGDKDVPAQVASDARFLSTPSA